VSDLLKNIETQDNRITELPIYYVIKRQHWVPCWEGECEKEIYVDCDGGEFDSSEDLIDHLIESERIEEDDRGDYDYEDDFESFGFNRVPVRYEEYENELDPIFLTEERAKAFCAGDRDKTAVTYVKHAGAEIKELIEMAMRADKAEAKLRRIEQVAIHTAQGNCIIPSSLVLGGES